MGSIGVLDQVAYPFEQATPWQAIEWITMRERVADLGERWSRSVPVVRFALCRTMAAQRKDDGATIVCIRKGALSAP